MSEAKKDESGLSVLLCDGGECCEDGHEGEVLVVNVTDKNSGHDWGRFNYCENAIKEDIDRGLLIEFIDT